MWKGEACGGNREMKAESRVRKKAVSQGEHKTDRQKQEQGDGKKRQAGRESERRSPPNTLGKEAEMKGIRAGELSREVTP